MKIVSGEEDQRLLHEVLPDEKSGDLAARLRKGLIKEIKRDNWPPADIETVMSTVGVNKESMIEALRPKSKKKRKSWWRDVFDRMAP